MPDLDELDIKPVREVFWNSPKAFLYEHAIGAGLGELAADGQIVVDTTPYSGSPPRDRSIVLEDRRPKAGDMEVMGRG